MTGWLQWIFRLVAAGILLPVAYLKLTGGEIDVMLFGMLGMEPHGRITIGSIELVAALLLLSPQAAIGALLAVGVMFGAIIAHLTVLGMDVGGDGGLHVLLLTVVLGTSASVLIARRRELPIVGSTLGGNGPHTTP